jgi:hypothetical protein
MNIIYVIIRRKAKWIGHILRRDCIPKRVIEATISVMRKRGKRRKQLLDDLKEETVN